MAEAFRADINSIRQRGAEQHAAELQRQLGEVAALAPDGSANPYWRRPAEPNRRVAVDASNQLQVLQPRAGVTENAPNIVSKLVLGAAGGLVLGILAALGLAALSTRLTNSADLRDKTGVEPLVEVPARRIGQAGQVAPKIACARLPTSSASKTCPSRQSSP